MTTQEVDPAAVQAFAGRMLEMLNGSAVTMMISIGHHTGLLDTMATLPPATSEQIAEAAHLQERYVRELLGSLVCGRVVEYDAGARTYRLPPEHAAVLTRAAGPDNMARFAAILPDFAHVQDGIIESFHQGGGVRYADYPHFQKLQAEESAAVVDATLLHVTLKLIAGLTERLEAGIDVADIACGAGHALNVMARAFPNSRFTGYDFSTEGIETAREEAARLGLTNATFIEQDVAALDAMDAYDFITVFDAVHDQAQPRRVLRNIRQALRPGGTLLIVDIQASSNLEENLEHPLSPALYAVSTMHCMTVSLALGGEGLGTMWGEQQARALLAEAGLTVQDVRTVEGDILNNYYICTKA